MIKATAIRAKPFNASVYDQEFHAAANRIADMMLKDSEATVETWDHKVKFEKQITASPARMSVSVFTYDKIYGMLDRGTKRHRVKPKKAGGVLAFPSAYKAKTKPRKLKSYRGGPSGDTVFVGGDKGVMHPGTEARKFSVEIAKKAGPGLRLEIWDACRRAAKRSGHGMK